MKRVLVLGCPGSGKSTFSRKLRDKTGLPLYHLDLFYHNEDRTTVDSEVFDERLRGVLALDEYILDGNYLRTLGLNSVLVRFVMICLGWKKNLMKNLDTM